MSCNPCCCWRLKDAVVTIGIWSTIYAIACLAVFAWQWGVLAQCQHMTMAQTNLPCEYYCPCVSASTARTAAIIEGRPSIPPTGSPPPYYESYWQSPEERYHTGLFVIQILCLTASFFLLLASIMLIYGVHTWSPYLIGPWFICMASSILTSLAYCAMWWAGDVPEYWLVLTILQIFCVFLNVYCFGVMLVFCKRMMAELEYHEGKRLQEADGFGPAKYDRFVQCQHTLQDTKKQDLDEMDDDFDGPGGGHVLHAGLCVSAREGEVYIYYYRNRLTKLCGSTGPAKGSASA